MSSDTHGAAVPQEHGLKHPYHLPDPSPWPILGALGGFLIVFGIIVAAHHENNLIKKYLILIVGAVILIVGAVLVLRTMFFWRRYVVREAWTLGALGGFLTAFGSIVLRNHENNLIKNYLILIAGVVLVIGTMFFWWRDVVREARTPGAHSPIVQLGLRYGMVLFISSEVMFFVGFFWSYFSFLFFPETQGNGQTVWPPTNIQTFDPFHLPLLNTMILLLSGCTVTWAHHGLLEGDKKTLVNGLGLTVLLGLTFTLCQAIEYSHSPFPLNGGAYPSVFFLATGFHGFHVIIGTLFLLVCWFRARDDQFTPERHFGFEAAAWYWHFVDVVWLFLFICIYWYGAGVIAAE